MELSKLKNKIIESYTGSDSSLIQLLSVVEKDKSVFPFNEYEYLICNMLGNSNLTLKDYLSIREDYINSNPYLWIFEISAPTTFGSFAETLVRNKCSKITKPSKRLDVNYEPGSYDLWLDGIRIEVKSSRVCSEGDKPLYVRALSCDTKEKFLMNFQQLKPQYCDVFVWVAVFRDEIKIWVMSSKEVSGNKYYSVGQHRGNSGNEGQLHVNKDNISKFDKYLLIGDDIEKAIRSAAGRNIN